MKQPLIISYRPEAYSTDYRTYVVLGAPRGGTSMLAGAMQILGVPMGSVNDQHEDPAFHDESNIDGIIKTISLRDRSHARWGWKLPNTIYYYRRISSALRNPVFLIVYRNPFDIFTSSTSKDRQILNDDYFNAPVYHYSKMHQIIHDEFNVPAYVMSYEAACAKPKQFVHELAAVLSTNPSESAIESCRRFVDPNKGYAEVDSPRDRFAQCDKLGK